MQPSKIEAFHDVHKQLVRQDEKFHLSDAYSKRYILGDTDYLDKVDHITNYFMHLFYEASDISNYGVERYNNFEHRIPWFHRELGDIALLIKQLESEYNKLLVFNTLKIGL